jgi:hypothetical protein
MDKAVFIACVDAAARVAATYIAPEKGQRVRVKIFEEVLDAALERANAFDLGSTAEREV